MNKIFWNTSTCNTEKKIQSYEFAKNQGTNFDKLQGFQVPLISPNALLTDLYIVQSATKYFINFIIYIYLYSNFLLFQFEAYDGGIWFVCRINFPNFYTSPHKTIVVFTHEPYGPEYYLYKIHMDSGIWIANTKQNYKFWTAWKDYKKVCSLRGRGQNVSKGGKESQEGEKFQGEQSLSWGGRANILGGGQCPSPTERLRGGGITPFASPLELPL